MSHGTINYTAQVVELHDWGTAWNGGLSQCQQKHQRSCAIKGETMHGRWKVTIMVNAHDFIMGKWLNEVGGTFNSEFKGKIFENLLPI